MSLENVNPVTRSSAIGLFARPIRHILTIIMPIPQGKGIHLARANERASAWLGAGSTPLKTPKILVVLGPTSTGKSDFAVDLALRLRSGQAINH